MTKKITKKELDFINKLIKEDKLMIAIFQVSGETKDGKIVTTANVEEVLVPAAVNGRMIQISIGAV